MQIPYSTDKDPKSSFQREEFSECILEAPRILQFDPESWASLWSAPKIRTTCAVETETRQKVQCVKIDTAEGAYCFKVHFVQKFKKRREMHSKLRSNTGSIWTLKNVCTSNSLSLCIRGVNFSLSTSQANGGCQSWEDSKKGKKANWHTIFGTYMETDVTGGFFFLFFFFFQNLDSGGQWDMKSTKAPQKSRNFQSELQLQKNKTKPKKSKHIQNM